MNYKKIALGMLVASNVSSTFSIPEPIAWLATGGITSLFGLACYNVGPRNWGVGFNGRIGFFEIFRNGTLPEQIAALCLAGATAGIGYLSYKTFFLFTPYGRLNRALRAVEDARHSPLSKAIFNNNGTNSSLIDTMMRVKVTSKFPLVAAVEELITIIDRLNYAQELCICAQEEDSTLVVACVNCLKDIESCVPPLSDALTLLKNAPGYTDQLNAYNKELARIAAESQAAAAWAANTRR